MPYDVHRGRRLLELRRWAALEAFARDGIAAEPECAPALRHLGSALENQGDLEGALAVAEAAVQADPHDLDGLITLTDLNLRLDRPAQAWASASMVLNQAPHWWVAHYDVARVLRTDPNNLLMAQRAADRALELAPHSADAHNLRGLILSDRSWTQEAERAYRAALAIDPHHALTLNNLATLNLQAGGLQSAAAQLSASLQSDPFGALPRRNMDILMAALIQRVALMAAVAGLILAVLTLLRLPYALRAGVGGLFLGVLVIYVRAVVTNIQAPTREVLRGIWSRWAGDHRYAVLSSVVLLMVFLVVAFGPDLLAGVVLVVMLKPLLLTLVLVACVRGGRWVFTRRRRSRSGSQP